MSILSNNYYFSLELEFRNRIKEIDYYYTCLEHNCPYCQDNRCDYPCYQELESITHASYPNKLVQPQNLLMPISRQNNLVK